MVTAVQTTTPPKHYLPRTLTEGSDYSNILILEPLGVQPKIPTKTHYQQIRPTNYNTCWTMDPCIMVRNISHNAYHYYRGYAAWSAVDPWMKMKTLQSPSSWLKLHGLQQCEQLSLHQSQCRPASRTIITSQNANYIHVTNNVHKLSFTLNAPILDFVNKNDLNKFKLALKIQTLTLHTDSQQLLWTAETCWLLSIWSDVQAERMSWILVQHRVKMVMITDVSSMMLKDPAGISTNISDHYYFNTVLNLKTLQGT